MAIGLFGIWSPPASLGATGLVVWMAAAQGIYWYYFGDIVPNSISASCAA